MADMVIETRVKEYAKKKGGETVRFSGSAIDALDRKIEKLIDDALDRAKGNGRVTVQEQDF